MRYDDRQYDEPPRRDDRYMEPRRDDRPGDFDLMGMGRRPDMGGNFSGIRELNGAPPSDEPTHAL